MEFENTVDKLREMEIEELLRLYEESSSYGDGSNQELIDLVAIEHEYLYGEVGFKFLDTAQMKNLNDEIGETILMKLLLEHRQKLKGDFSNLENSISYGASSDNYLDLSKIKSIEFTHGNCYWATVDVKYIEYIMSHEDFIGICLKQNYDYIKEGYPRWDSIEPFNKDEITSITLNFTDSGNVDRYVPFENVSNSGSYNENGKSRFYYSKNYLLIEWSNDNL